MLGGTFTESQSQPVAASSFSYSAVSSCMFPLRELSDRELMQYPDGQLGPALTLSLQLAELEAVAACSGAVCHQASPAEAVGACEHHRVVERL